MVSNKILKAWADCMQKLCILNVLLCEMKQLRSKRSLDMNKLQTEKLHVISDHKIYYLSSLKTTSRILVWDSQQSQSHDMYSLWKNASRDYASMSHFFVLKVGGWTQRRIFTCCSPGLQHRSCDAMNLLSLFLNFMIQLVLLINSERC